MKDVFASVLASLVALTVEFAFGRIVAVITLVFWLLMAWHLRKDRWAWPIVCVLLALTMSWASYK